MLYFTRSPFREERRIKTDPPWSGSSREARFARRLLQERIEAETDRLGL